MNNKYKDFYFLHIRKTGGRYVKLFILKNLKNSINVIETGEKHSGWIDKITPETYVFTVFRDPVKQICSLYAHAVSQKANLLEISKNSEDHLDNLNKNIKVISRATDHQTIKRLEDVLIGKYIIPEEAGGTEIGKKILSMLDKPGRK